MPYFIRQLVVVIDRQQAELEVLKTQLTDLPERLKQQSPNPNRPPASDRFHKPHAALPKKPPPRRRPGGQWGKPLQPGEPPALVIGCQPGAGGCGGGQSAEAGDSGGRRHVVELPEPPLEVVEERRSRRRGQGRRQAWGDFREAVLAAVPDAAKRQGVVARLSVRGGLSVATSNQRVAELDGYEVQAATAQALLNRPQRCGRWRRSKPQWSPPRGGSLRKPLAKRTPTASACTRLQARNGPANICLPKADAWGSMTRSRGCRSLAASRLTMLGKARLRGRRCATRLASPRWCAR